MATGIDAVPPVNPYTVRRVARKRDHEGKRDYSHQDADGFAEDLTELLEDGHPHHEEPEQSEPDQPAEDQAEDTPQTPRQATHLDIEA